MMILSNEFSIEDNFSIQDEFLQKLNAAQLTLDNIFMMMDEHTVDSSVIEASDSVMEHINALASQIESDIESL